MSPTLLAQIHVLLFLFGLTSAAFSASLSANENIKPSGLPDFNNLWDYSDPAETRTRFQQVLEDTQNTTDLSYLLQLKTQIARTYSLQGEFEKAHAVLDKIEPQLTADTALARVRYFLERGRTYNSASQKQQAIQLFIKAYELGKEIKADSYTIDAAHMVALAAADLVDKLEWNNKGLTQAKAATDESSRRWIGVFHNNMGWDLFDTRQYEKALDHFNDSLSFYQQIGSKKRASIARWSVAKTLRLMGKVDESLLIQLALLKETQGEDKTGYGYEELGELYWLKGEQSLASDYFAKAYAVLSKDSWLQKNEVARLERLKQLSSQ